MAATEYDIIRDEQERSNWQRVIADVEVAIATSTPGTRRTFENTLDSAKKRVATLDKKIDDAKVEQRAEEHAKIAAANLVETEKALSASEKETYDGFLKEAFFTKKDFGKLEQFYAHTYDRLSEGGKDEMSHRVWEGVRHGEYRFTDLPKDVREKEEDRIYKKFTDPSRGRDSLEHIPEADRKDFIQAYKAGDRKEIGGVLNRESFRRNVATEDSKSIKHQVVTIGKAADDHEVLADDKTKDIAPSGSSTMASIKSASEKLKDLTLDDSPSAPSAAAIPSAGASQGNTRSPT